MVVGSRADDHRVMTTATTHPRPFISSHKTGATAVAGGVLGLLLGAGGAALLVNAVDTEPAVATKTSSSTGDTQQFPDERDPFDTWLKQRTR